MADDNKQSMSKRLAAPIVVSLALVASVTCFMCWSVTWSEFHHFEQVVEKEKSEFPSYCESFRRVEFLNLAIPLAVLAWSGRLLREEIYPLRQLVWFACSTILTVFLWATASFVAVYLLHLKFYRYF